MMAMDIQYDEESLIQLTIDLLRTDEWKEDIYLRPTIYKSDLGIGVRLHDLKDEFSMFVTSFDKYVKNYASAHLTFSSWRRIDDNVIPARGKVAGAYANSALIKTDANRAGFDEAIVLDQNGHVSEGSAMNIFMIRDGVLITPPATDNILEGITRRCVMDLARNELGLNYPCALTPLPTALPGIPAGDRNYINHVYSMLLKCVQAKTIMLSKLKRGEANSAYTRYYAETYKALETIRNEPTPAGLESFRNQVMTAITTQVNFFSKATKASSSASSR